MIDPAYRALEGDCVALVGVINSLREMIETLLGGDAHDDLREALCGIDDRLDDIYARRLEWLL